MFLVVFGLSCGGRGGGAVQRALKGGAVGGVGNETSEFPVTHGTERGNAIDLTAAEIRVVAIQAELGE